MLEPASTSEALAIPTGLLTSLAGCVILSAANTPNESAESTRAAVADLIYFIILFSYLINAEMPEASFLPVP